VADGGRPGTSQNRLLMHLHLASLAALALLAGAPVITSSE